MHNTVPIAGIDRSILEVTLTNDGFVPIHVNHLGWEYGIIRKKGFIQHAEYTSTGSVPEVLQHGDQGTYRIPLEERGEASWAEALAAHLRPFPGRFIRVLFVKTNIITTTGSPKRRLPRRLRKILLEQAKHSEPG